MASLVFSLADGRVRAFAFESGDVIEDFNSLEQWEVTNDTDRLQSILSKMTIAKIDSTLRSLNFSTRKGCTKAVMIRSFLEQWERIKVGALATHAHNQAMAYLQNEATANAPASSSNVATGSDGSSFTPFNGYAHRLADEVNADPSTNLLGNSEVDDLITQAREMGWKINVIRRANMPNVRTNNEKSEDSESEKSEDRESENDFTLADFLETNTFDEDDTHLFYQFFLEDGTDFITKTVRVMDWKRNFKLLEFKALASTTISFLKNMICDGINEMRRTKHIGGNGMTIRDFNLINNGVKMHDDDVLDNFQDDEGENDHVTVYLRLVLRGGGKMLGAKKASITKKTIIEEKKKDVLVKVMNVNIVNMVVEKKTIEEAGQSMTTLYNCAETDGMTAFKYLLQKLSTRNLGDRKSSPAIDALNATHVDMRLVKLGDMMLRDTYPSLFTLSDEVSGMLESAELTFDYILHCAFLKESGSMNWAEVKRAIEDEQVRRSPPADIAGEDMSL
ncbi:unnamed protein product [Effrenium voratum]|uniref:Uncharacterized protein n=1 Tax=Effrenium voratum TaxID=2562239 RepID=A0AA36IW27_9DINO|nr:unnamed protein product [Effrenium voratum]